MHHTLSTLRTFAHEHDEIPAFHAGFLVITFLIAALFTMGSFGLLILAHMSLDIVKYREVHGYGWWKVAGGVLRESLVDLTLFCVGLTFAVYFHHSVVGMTGLSGLLRAEVTLIEFIGTTIPKMEVFQRFLKIVAHLQHYLDHVHERFQRRLSFVEQVYLFALSTSVLFLVFSPFFLHLDAVTLWGILLEEVIPHVR